MTIRLDRAPTKRLPVLTDTCANCWHEHVWHIGVGQCVSARCSCKHYRKTTPQQLDDKFGPATGPCPGRYGLPCWTPGRCGQCGGAA